MALEPDEDGFLLKEFGLGSTLARLYSKGLKKLNISSSVGREVLVV